MFTYFTAACCAGTSVVGCASVVFEAYSTLASFSEDMSCMVLSLAQKKGCGSKQGCPKSHG